MDAANLNDFIKNLGTWIWEIAPKFILAISILLIGFWLVKKVLLVLHRILAKAFISPELEGFLTSMASIALKIIVVLFAAGTLGFQVSSIVGVLAGIVFAIGLALQGFLGNFASGMTIIFFKPYKVGDWVQISDVFGRVERIEIFNTLLVTPGNKTLIVPNGKVTDSIITNFSMKNYIRLELKVTMAYSESFPKVRETIEKALHNFPVILQEPAPIIGIESFDSHNILVSVRPCILPDDYWTATFETYQRIKHAFNESGIEVAYSEGIELGKIGD